MIYILSSSLPTDAQGADVTCKWYYCGFSTGLSWINLFQNLQFFSSMPNFYVNFCDFFLKIKIYCLLKMQYCD